MADQTGAVEGGDDDGGGGDSIGGSAGDSVVNLAAAAEEIRIKVEQAIQGEDFALARTLVEKVTPSAETVLGPLRWTAIRDWGFRSQNETGRGEEGKCILYECSGARSAGVVFSGRANIDVGVYVSAE